MAGFIKYLRRLTLSRTTFLIGMLVFLLNINDLHGKNVLIINSYDSEFLWTHDQVKGFVDEVTSHNPETQFFCEYLDAKRVNVTLYQRELAKLLAKKYQGKNISLIYATDDKALEFTQAFGEKMGLEKIPIIASGINNPYNLDNKTHPWTKGILEVQSAGDLVRLALKQNPKTTKIVIICDGTDVGQDIANDIDVQAKEISGLPIVTVPNVTWNEMLAYISKFDRNTLFLLGLYSVDIDSKYIPPYEVATQTSKTAKGPVYAFHDIFTCSPGIVGGYVNAGLDQGSVAGQMAVFALGNKTSGHTEARKPGFKWVFNYEAMKRFGISESTLPPGSTVYNKPKNILKSHPFVFLSILLGVAGETLLIVFLLLNIRKRNTATLALRQSEERLRLLLENSPLAVFITDKEGKIILLNSQFRTLFGYGIAEIKTLDNLKKMLLPDPVYRARIEKKIIENSEFADENGTMPIPVEYEARAKNGNKLEVEMYFAETGGMLFRILHDVTERNRTIRELRQASASAMAANETKSRFIANVSHEIRTPMNGILGMIQLLQETPVTPDQRDYIETIEDSCGILLTVINDILDLSRIEAGQMKLSLEPCCLKTFLKSVSNIAGPAIEAKGLEFVCDYPKIMPDTVLCDSSRVKQVLLNLLINASKFTDKGQVELHLNCERLQKAKYKLGFAIVDTGIGIPSEMQDKIFEPFMQADSSRTRKFGGTGLGLSISGKLVQIMGGRLILKSESGTGSTFSFDIIVDEVLHQDAKQAGTEHIDAETAHKFPLKILVAEDNAVNQKVVGMMLHKMGYDFDIVANGIDAIEIATRKNFDVILMDVQMPMLDGLNASIKIRQLLPPEKQPQIFALTAHAMSDDAQRCIDAGMNGHLVKPLRVSALKDALMDAYTHVHSTETAR